MSFYTRVRLFVKDSVTDRVAGFVCKYVLRQHSGCVTGLALVEDQNSVYLVHVNNSLYVSPFVIEDY